MPGLTRWPVNADGDEGASMRCLTYSECSDWCRAHGYPVMDADHYGNPAPRVLEAGARIAVQYPDDSGQKVLLAREVIGQLANAGEMLLWLDNWAVWPNSQHMPLFTRFREALGESRPVIEAPGHLIQAAALDDAVSVLAVAMLFFWDCHVFPASGPVFVTSHDEWNAFVTLENLQIEITSTFARWLLPEAP